MPTILSTFPVSSIRIGGPLKMGTWRNLDSSADYDVCCKALGRKDARSFAVRFKTDKAECALDLDKTLVDSIIKESAPESLGTPCTRWLNFWAGADDKTSITTIAKHYGVSPRLTSLLCTTPAKPHHVSRNDTAPSSGNRQHQARATNSDVESFAGLSDSFTSHSSSAARLTDFSAVFGDLWHFCSVDRGPEYVYVGFNSLFTIPGAEASAGADRSKPSGLRLWTSLLLCNDGTVVSIYEQPPSDTSWEHLKFTRRNVMNVFYHLSSLHSSATVNSLMQISVRPSNSSDQASMMDADSAALLFYYLFDDWTTTLNLITQRYNPYHDKLEEIRQHMFDTADTGLIRALDLVGRQLTTLELMYKSYALIITRLLKPRTSKQTYDSAMVFSHRAGSLPAMPTDASQDVLAPALTPPSDTGVELSLPALLRFERLLDRIRLYALVEIEECVKQKDSLVLMNFNLIALKESQAVEKLTRTTILLAKVTILFLPVSLMTGYFSLQMSEIDELYNLHTYWFSFLVVVVLTVLGLVAFGLMAERVGGKMAYKSLTRTCLTTLNTKKRKFI